MTDKQIINGIKYEKLTQDQLHDLSQWELVDIILSYRKDVKAKKKECKRLEEELYYWVNGEYCDNKCNVVKELDQLKGQLQRAESQIAEDETLQCDMREAIEELKAELEQEKALKETYLACYKAKHDDIEGKLFKLKAENENWQKEYWKLEQGNDFWAETNSRLKQTLTEIKEIAEHCINQDICTTCDNSDKCHIKDEEIPTYDVCKLILQKISEVEDA